MLRSLKKQYIRQIIYTIGTFTKGLPGAFSEKSTADIAYFTDEPIVPCDIPVMKNTPEDNSK